MNWILLKNSLLVGGLATAGACALGFAAALCLAGSSKSWRVGILLLAILSLALPPFLVTNAWLDLLGATGLWRRWLPFNIVSLGGSVWILSLLLWPITLFALSSAWQRLQAAQLESDLSLRGWLLIRTLLLPLGHSAFLQAALLTFVLAVNNFAVPAILQIKVLPAEMWVRFNTSFDTWGTLRLSGPLLLAPILLLLWLGRREEAWPRLQNPIAPTLLRRQLGRRWFMGCAAVTCLLCCCSVGVPLFQLIMVKRTWTEMPGAIAAGLGALWNSLFFAGAAGTLVLGLALLWELFVAADVRRRTNTRLKNSAPHVGGYARALLWLPLLAPGVLIGIGLIAAFNRPWTVRFYQSAGIVISAYFIRYFAIGSYTAGHAAAAVDHDLLDDARTNGAGRWQLARWVQWPQMAPQLAAFWYVIFLLCLWDVESMILVVPPGGETLALRIFNLLHYGHNAQVNALCLTLLGIAIAPLLVWQAGRRATSRFGPQHQTAGTGTLKSQ